MFQVRLKILREEFGLSQYGFSEKFGVAQSTVGMWEAGKREPNFETAHKIADFFDVSVDYLLGLTDNKKPAAQDRQPVIDPDKLQLLGECEGLKPEDVTETIKYIRYLKSQNSE